MDAVLDLVRQDKLLLYISDITLKEVERHIYALVKRDIKSYNRALDGYMIWQKRVSKEETKNISSEDITRISKQCFDKFVMDFGFEFGRSVIPATRNVATAVFKKYFERQPPFDSEDSKEFPDAFVIESLNLYCVKNKIKMNIVSGDKAFIRAALISEKLLGFSSVGDLTALFAAVENPGLLKYVQKFLASDVDMAALQSRLDSAIDTSHFYYSGDYNDGELDEVSIAGDIEIEDYKILSHGESLDLILHVKTPLVFNLSYEDVSEAIYDNEDDIYFGSENQQTQFDSTCILRVYVKFDGDKGAIEKLSIIGSEIAVEEERDWYS